MWVDNSALGTKSDTVSAGNVTVSATATAAQIVWDMGNGDSVTCNGPGTPYDPSHPNATPTCSYTYKRSSAPQAGHTGDTYTVKATAVWTVTYTVAGAPGGGSLPSITRTATTTVRVAEAQAINTG
jgi:hypothetical protein